MKKSSDVGSDIKTSGSTKMLVPKTSILKERIVIRHPSVLSNLSCIDSVIMSVNGVLTTGTYKIMAISSLKKNYFLDAKIDDDLKVDDPLKLNQLGTRLGTGILETETTHQAKSEMKLDCGDELAVLEYLKFKFDSDAKFYNNYKEKVELKEGNNGIKEEEIEKYSEKSQEFERELDGEFIEEVFDEESEDSFAYIRNGDYNHLSMKISKPS